MDKYAPYHVSIGVLLNGLKPRQKNAHTDLVAFAKVISVTGCPKDQPLVAKDLELAIDRLGGYDSPKFTTSDRAFFNRALAALAMQKHEADLKASERANVGPAVASGVVTRELEPTDGAETY